jgi:hypothetical protein
MKTVLAMVLGSMFLAGSAMACPGESGAKDTKTADGKTKSDTKTQDKKTTT